jgi:signal transduction histidine kinase
MRLASGTVDRATGVESPQGGRVLVVDRDEAIARTMAAVLRHEGYAVAVADSLAPAPEYREYDLLLLDLRLDDGDDLLTQARRLAPAAVVIALAQFATFEAALRALRAGAYDYLLKPVDVEELRLAVERGLAHRRLERELAARVAELEAAHRAARDFNAQLRRQVREATAELSAKVQALDAAMAHSQQVQAEHERFVAMVAHEMRGPLNIIINYAQLARRPGISQQATDQYTDNIVEHAFRLNRLVDDLQTATRLSTGQFTLQRRHCDVAAAVAEVVENFSATVHGRRFALERPDGPVYAEVDPDRIVQAVRNLVDNAVKYSADGGAVELAVWSDSSRVYVRVRDYGAGIPEAEMQRIFEAFTRLEHRRDVSGSGLGLYITRGIVEAHGGELTVHNGSGSQRVHGAVFTIALPLRASPTALPASGQ